MNKLEVLFFYFGIVTILAHLVRNLNPLYYIILAFVILLFLVLSLRNFRKPGFQTISLVTIAVVSYVAVVSLIAEVSHSAAVGIGRLFYLAPVVIYCFSTNISNRQALAFWRIIVLFLIASSLSILLQYATGPISWFADHSERAGVDRYASLAGSLTSFGSLVGVAVFAARELFKIKTIYMTAQFLLVLGAVLSLQKMALFSLGLSLTCVAIGAKKRLLAVSLVKLTFSIGIIAFALYFLLLNYYPHHLNYIGLIFTADASQVGDVSAVYSAIDRLTSLPLEAFDYWGYLNVALGVGVFGGSGGLGYPELPMAHNLIAEVFLIFGVLPGSLILMICGKYLWRALRFLTAPTHSRLKIASASFLTLLVGSVFTGGLFYHPVAGLVFWFSLSEMYKLNRSLRSFT